MNNNSTWDAYCKAEDNFFSKRYDLMARNDFELILSNSLRSPNESEYSLRLINSIDIKEDFFELNISALIDLAINGPMRTMGLAEIIIKEKVKNKDFLQMALDKKVNEYMNSEDDFVCRRLADILFLFDSKETLKNLVNKYKSHNNEHIREIGDDFSRRIIK